MTSASSSGPKSAGGSRNHDGSEKKDRKEGSSSSQPPDTMPTKVVVRRLPPNMTLLEFLDGVSPLPPHDYLHFSRPDASLGYESKCPFETFLLVDVKVRTVVKFSITSFYALNVDLCFIAGWVVLEVAPMRQFRFPEVRM